jgi:thiamine-phosphate pyrophosphorylase
MLVTNKGTKPLIEYLELIRACAKAGVTSVQLREKNASYEALYELGMALKNTLTPFNIPLIINDDVKLALELDADGVHLGQKDGDALEARAALGREKIIGVSVDSITQLHIANSLPIDYVGCGAIFPTKSKTDVATTWGTEGLEQFCQISKYKVIAIGGVTESNASAVARAGADGIAAISVFHDSANLSFTIKTLLNIMTQETES